MTIVYSYHCEPAEEADELALIEQLRLAALYRRALAQSENRGRALWRSWSRLVTPEARAAMAALRKDTAVFARVEEVLAWRGDGPCDWRPLARRHLVDLDVDPDVAARMVEREDISSAQQRQDKASRTEFAELGLGWGTYQHVEEAQAASCRMTIRDKDVWVPPPIPIGCVAVHLQPARPLRGEGDLWIRIGTRLVVRRGWQRIGDRFVRREGDLDMSGRVRPARHREVALRIGTLSDRTPRWVNLLVRVDRDLPSDARVSWAMVTRRRIADAHRWEVKIVFDAPSLMRPVTTLSSSPHAAGVDVGWRRMDGCVRVAAWWGTDGRFGEVTIPDEVLGADDKSDSLRAIRDRMRDALRTKIVEWARDHEISGTWLEEELAHAHQWQRYGRFARLARLWAHDDRRVAGDDGIRAELFGWVKQNRHLWRWEAFGRQKRGRRVAEVIRQFAVRLSREYGRIGIERPFISKLVKKEERCEACRDLPKRCAACNEQERMRRLASTRVPHAAPAKTREELKRFAKKYGAALVECDPANTSRDCSTCGQRRDDVADWSPRVIRCSTCGASEDQDITAAKNLAGFASRAQLDENGRPVASADGNRRDKKVLAARRTRRARRDEVDKGAP